MRIGILQPCFIPWMGYFEQINHVDLFVFQDDVQYTKKDWRNRNYIFSFNKSDQIEWLTIPVKKSKLDTLLNKKEIFYEDNWKIDHLRKIEASYKRTKYFTDVYELLERNYNKNFIKLTDLCIQIIIEICKELKIDTKFYFSSKIKKNSLSITERICEIAKFFNAKEVYLGQKAKGYVYLDDLKKEKIHLSFQQFKIHEYSQQSKTFKSNLSIIDTIMNVGFQNTKELIIKSH